MYLLDTHTLLWTLFEGASLSDNALKAIMDDNDIFVSIASLWEIAIKQSIGKLEIDASIESIVKACEIEDFNILAIEPAHLDYIKVLPKIHGDPFDRLIISQAMAEGLTLITRDAKMPLYGIKTLW